MEDLDAVVTIACVAAFVFAMAAGAWRSSRERGQAHPASPNEQLIVEGMAAFKAGDPARAEELVDAGTAQGDLPEGARRVARQIKARALEQTSRYGELAAFLAAFPDDSGLDRMRLGAAVMTGDLDQADRLLSEPSPDPASEVERLREFGAVRLRQERYADADALLDEAARLSAEVHQSPDDAWRTALVTTWQAMAALRAGDLDGAVELIDVSRAGLPETGSTSNHRGLADLLAAEIHAARDEVATARRRLADATARLAGSAYPLVQARVAVVEAEVAWAAGDNALARVRFTEAISAHERMGVRLEVERLTRRLTELDRSAPA